MAVASKVGDDYGSICVTGVSGGSRKKEWANTGCDGCRCLFSQHTA